MLYKKYHRNYVKQFNIKTKIYLDTYDKATKQKGPYIDFGRIEIIYNFNLRILISQNGKLEKYAIQKIS